MNFLKVRAALRLIVRPLCRALLMFIPAGTLHWTEGWIYFAHVSIAETCIAFWVLRNDPNLAQRRLEGGAKAEQRGPQKLIMALVTPLAGLLLVVPALCYRFGWQKVPAGFVFLGHLFIFCALLAVFHVFRQNSFASSIITVEPGQLLVRTGLYSRVRHPMYSALTLFNFGVPLALGFSSGLVISVALMLLLILRLLDEEKLLRSTLEGYSDYCAAVKYRLVPSVW